MVNGQLIGNGCEMDCKFKSKWMVNGCEMDVKWIVTGW